MDHTYIEEQDVIERYLLGHLDAGEKERFEAHYLGCQACLDQLELAEEMIAGAKKAAAEDAARPLAAPASEKSRNAPPAKVLSFPQRYRSQLVLAAAALLLLAFGLPRLLRQGGAVAPVSVAVLDIERGGAGPASTRIELPAQGSLIIALEVQQMRPRRRGTFKASLYRQNASQVLWQGQDLELRQDLVSLLLPRSLVPPGEYEILLQTSAGVEVGQYRFATREAP